LAIPVSAPELLNPLGEISQLVDCMESTGEIDLTVVPKLSIVMSHARTNLEFWRTATDVSKETAFVEYHAWRNIFLVLSVMKDRFEHASAMHENPEVAAEANAVLPSVFVAISLLYEIPPREIGDRERSQILERLRTLRSAALRSNMSPSLNQELADVDVQDLRNRLAGLAQTIGTELVEG